MIHFLIVGETRFEFSDRRTLNGFAASKCGNDFLFITGNRAYSVPGNRSHHALKTFLSDTHGRSKYSCARHDQVSNFFNHALWAYSCMPKKLKIFEGRRKKRE